MIVYKKKGVLLMNKLMTGDQHRVNFLLFSGFSALNGRLKFMYWNKNEEERKGHAHIMTQMNLCICT